MLALSLCVQCSTGKGSLPTQLQEVHKCQSCKASLPAGGVQNRCVCLRGGGQRGSSSSSSRAATTAIGGVVQQCVDAPEQNKCLYVVVAE